MENLKALFDLTKLPAKFFFLFAVVSGFILFADPIILKRIHLEKINETYGWIIGLVFISTAGLILVNFVIWAFKTIYYKFRFFKVKKEYIAILRNLDIHEKAVLREFIITQKSSIEVPIDNPTITGLIRKKIISINQQFGNGFIMTGMNASVSMNKFVEKHLTLADIDLKDHPTKEEIENIRALRPDWIERHKWRY